MNREDIIRIITKAVDACIRKDAVDFAILFADDGKIILNKDKQIIKNQIEKITADYFSNLASIKIDIHSTMIEGDRAFVEWSWEDFNILKQQKNCHDNVIALKFVDNLIFSWREYKS